MSVVDDLQEVAALFGGKRRNAPVVQDQHLHARQALEHAGIATIAASQAKVLEQSRNPMIEHSTGYRGRHGGPWHN